MAISISPQRYFFFPDQNVWVNSYPQIEFTFTNGLTCGIFIIPDNKASGMLENLCLESVKTKPVYDEAEGYVEKAEALMRESDRKKYNKPKAIIQTYLAGQPRLE